MSFLDQFRNHGTQGTSAPSKAPLSFGSAYGSYGGGQKANASVSSVAPRPTYSFNVPGNSTDLLAKYGLKAPTAPAYDDRILRFGRTSAPTKAPVYDDAILRLSRTPVVTQSSGLPDYSGLSFNTDGFKSYVAGAAPHLANATAGTAIHSFQNSTGQKTPGTNHVRSVVFDNGTSAVQSVAPPMLSYHPQSGGISHAQTKKTTPVGPRARTETQTEVTYGYRSPGRDILGGSQTPNSFKALSDQITTALGGDDMGAVRERFTFGGGAENAGLSPLMIGGIGLAGLALVAMIASR